MFPWHAPFNSVYVQLLFLLLMFRSELQIVFKDVCIFLWYIVRSPVHVGN